MIQKNSIVYDIETATHGASFQELEKTELGKFLLLEGLNKENQE